MFKAFCEEFKANEPVSLQVKINPSYNDINWNLNIELDKLKLEPNHAEIRIAPMIVDFKQLPNFYNEGHVFVAPCMAEAFGLPIAEAMACELPVITTGFGGQIDFVINKENGLLIDYDLVQANDTYLYEEVRWAKPRIEHLRKLMRYAFEHQSEMKEMGKKAREKIMNEFQWKHSAEKILKYISELN